MASGLGGSYQGSVVDNADPIGEHRLRVIVPEVSVSWASRVLTAVDRNRPRQVERES